VSDVALVGLYSVPKKTRKRSTYYAGEVIISIDKDVKKKKNDDDEFRFKYRLIMYSMCPDKNDRLLAYDTYHDDAHYDDYGLVHKHACGQDTVKHMPCDVKSVLILFLDEVISILENCGHSFYQKENVIESVSAGASI
jgi:hypothetical protein